MPDLALIGPPWRTVAQSAVPGMLAADPPALVASDAWAAVSTRTGVLRRCPGPRTAGLHASILAATGDGTALVMKGAVQTVSGQWIFPYVHERVEVDKALNPRNARDFQTIVGRARDRLLRAARGSEAEAMSAMVPSISAADWAALDAVTANAVIDEIEAGIIGIAADPRFERAFVGLGAETQATAAASAKSTVIRGSGGSLSRADRELARRIGSRRGGVFLTDEYGRRALQYEARAAAIIGDAAGTGASSHAIGRELASTLGSSVTGRSASYFQVVANAAIGQARSFGELTSMRDAGLRSYTWVSVLDERTCFAAGTRVHMADETARAIDEIVPGDRIMSCRGVPRRVVAVVVHPADVWVDLSLSDGRRISVTPNHPILTRVGWVKAGSLRSGDDLVSCPDEPSELQGLWQDDRATAGSSASVLLRPMQDRGEEMRVVRRRVSGDAHLRQTGPGQVLFGAMSEGGEAGRRVGGVAHSDLRAVRGSVCGASGAHQSAALLLDGVPTQPGFSVVRALREVVRVRGGIRRAPSVLLGGVLPAVSGGDVAGADRQMAARSGAGVVSPGGEDRAMVRGLFDRRSDRAGGGRGLLALESVGTCAGHEEGRGARESRLHRNPAAGKRDPVRPGLRAARIAGLHPEPQLDRFEAARTVRVVGLITRIERAPSYDIQVESDAGYIAEGVVVHNSDICDMLDGKEFPVQASLDRFARADVASPEGAIDEFPWYSIVGGAIMTGPRGSAPEDRTTVATIDQPRTDTSRGSYSTVTPPILAGGTPTPPAHGNCRSLLQPEF